MKKILVFIGILFCINAVAQISPQIIWQRFLGSSGFDGATSIQQTSDEGYIVVGYSDSIGGNVTLNHGNSDYWIVKLNSRGGIQWQKSLGGSNDEVPNSVQETTDGGYIIAGYTNSNNGDVILNHGGSDYWIVKLNSSGDIQWQKSLGGSGKDRANSIQQTIDGGYIIAGWTESNDGDISFNINNGNERYYWIVKLNTNGMIEWEKSLRLSYSFGAKSIQQTTDGGYILVGAGVFFNGNVIGSHGAWDYRVVKLNNSGTIEWERYLGGSNDDIAHFIQQTSDGGYIVAGYSMSNDGDVSENHGDADYWIVKLNDNGIIEWEKSFGGQKFDCAYSIQQTSDGGYIVAGQSLSIDGDIIESHGAWDCWILKINSSGVMKWQKNLGGASGEVAYSIKQTTDEGYILAGYSYSSIVAGDYGGGNNGLYDYYIARLAKDPEVNILKGLIYTDSNHDCQPQTMESKIHSVLVKTEPDDYYGISDIRGNYQVYVDTGMTSYTLSQQFSSINSKLFINQCTTSYTIAASGSNQDFGDYNFADSIKQCSLVKVNIAQTRFRRCFQNIAYIDYKNYGSTEASNVSLTIELPTYVIPISSMPTWSSRNENIVIYNLGTIASNQGGKIIFVDSVVCGDETIRGLTQCIKARITPATHCEQPSLAWDESSIRVNGFCNEDSLYFNIRNEGDGDMSSSQAYRIFRNDTLIYYENYLLDRGEEFEVAYPADGNTIRIEADQNANHPGKSQPRFTLEDCKSAVFGDANSRGLVNTAPQDDEDEETAISCGVIVDSYDPNDKQVQPIGIGSNHQIVTGQSLDYTIRFQNTGTDKAINIKIVDTLDANLDAASFMEGIVSHPYTLNVTGKGQPVLTWMFNNINLPDSATNQLGSHGLVSFRINLSDNVVIGHTIHNKAYIFFDYNSAIITNEIIQTVGVTEVQDLSFGSKVHVGAVTTDFIKGIARNSNIKLYPNPTNGMFNVEIPDHEANMELRLVTVLGKVVRNYRLENQLQHQLGVENLPMGIYYYELIQAGHHKAGGIIEIR